MDNWKPVREIPKLAQLLNDRIASEPNKVMPRRRCRAIFALFDEIITH